MTPEEAVGELKDRLLGRVVNGQGVGCILCTHILTDLGQNARLTNRYPEPCFDGKPHFPVEGKVQHLKLEGFWSEGLKVFVPAKS